MSNGNTKYESFLVGGVLCRVFGLENPAIVSSRLQNIQVPYVYLIHGVLVSSLFSQVRTMNVFLMCSSD